MSGLRGRLSRAYVDGVERGPRRPRHPVMAVWVFVAGWIVLWALVGASTGDAGVGTGAGIGVLVYFVPCLAAWGRQVRNPGQVAAVNLFLGWTLIGWVVALVMALGTRR